MMYSRILMMAPTVLAGAIVCAPAGWGAEIDGKWQGSHPGPGGVVRVLFDLRTEGESVSGTVTNELLGESEIQDGMIRGDEITFLRVVQRGRREITFHYRGRIGDGEILFTRTAEGAGRRSSRGGGTARGGMGGRGMMGEVEFTAVRAPQDATLKVRERRRMSRRSPGPRGQAELPEPIAEGFTPRRLMVPQKPITDAEFLRPEEVGDQVLGGELVLGVVVNGEARAYPINMLSGARREIINDRLGGAPIAATW